jgi:hypothetical protein
MWIPNRNEIALALLVIGLLLSVVSYLLAARALRKYRHKMEMPPRMPPWVGLPRSSASMSERANGATDSRTTSLP